MDWDEEMHSARIGHGPVSSMGSALDHASGCAGEMGHGPVFSRLGQNEQKSLFKGLLFSEVNFDEFRLVFHLYSILNQRDKLFKE